MTAKAQVKTQSDTDKLRQRNRELSILNTIAEALNREIDLSQALRTTLAQVAELFELHTSWIWLLHEDTNEPYLAAAQNLPPALADAPERMEGSCYCLDTFQAGDLGGGANVHPTIVSPLQAAVPGPVRVLLRAACPLY